MSAATIETTTAGLRPTERVRSSVSSPVRTRRPRRPGPGTGPAARPVGLVPAPSVAPSRTARPRACQVEAPSHRKSSWRLTDRGVALVLVLALLIGTAAVAVVALTAFRVTSDGYHVVPSPQVGAPAAP